MIHTLLLAGAMFATVPEPPVDPAMEIMILDVSWDPTVVCAPMQDVVDIFTGALGDAEMAVDFVVYYGVEIYEEGYGQNLTEEGEDYLEELLRECLL